MSNIFQKLRDDHRNFGKGNKIDFDGQNPWSLFETWYSEAYQAKVNEPNAFALSTVSPTGCPSSRIVYLKEFIDHNFVFYTNYESQKAQEIAQNPNVSMLFFWPELERQIRIDGFAKKVDFSVSEEYFKSRPRASQLGAWASHQSQPLGSTEDLVLRLEELDKKYPEAVPCPPHWGGYSVVPNLLEFWQGQPSRLHDRLVFNRENSEWKIFHKNP